QWGVAQTNDVPGAEDFGVPTPDLQADIGLPDLDIQILDLNDIFIAYRDESSQMDTKFDVSQLSAQIDKLDLNEENIHVKELKLGPSDSEIFFGKMAASSPELSNDE